MTRALAHCQRQVAFFFLKPTINKHLSLSLSENEEHNAAVETHLFQSGGMWKVEDHKRDSVQDHENCYVSTSV